MNKTVLAIMLLGGLFTTAGAAAQAQDKVIEGKTYQAEIKHNTMEKLDTDKDGKISKAEAEKAPKGNIHKHFDHVDANKDGFVDQKELEAYRKEKKAEKNKKQE